MFRINKVRLGVQLTSFFLIIYGGAIGFSNTSLALPIFACSIFSGKRVFECYPWLLQKELTREFHSYYLSLLVPTILFIGMLLLFGKAWCGWVCPFGFVQDLMSRIRKCLKKRYFNIQPTLQRKLRSIPYILLFLTILISLGIGIPALGLTKFNFDLFLPFCQICPAKGMLSLFQWTVAEKNFFVIDNFNKISLFMTSFSLIIFIIFVVGASLIRRFWCAYCPVIALVAIFRKVSVLSLTKEGSRCTKCGICARSCPMQTTKVYEEKIKTKILTSECIFCFHCVEMCPEDNCLKINFFGKSLYESKYTNFMKGQK